jgi:bifunctional DNA-binding transcriptional regulator/antitoxin component of YhaV-PrlF toxin-antitoxin module
MELIAVKSRRQIVLPRSIYEQMDLSAGDVLEARVKGGKITLSRKTAMERAVAEGLEDVRKGRVYGPFDAVDQMLSSLKGKPRKSAKPRRTP